MRGLHTPEEGVCALPGCHFKPRSRKEADTQGRTVRLHCVDEDGRSGRPALRVHADLSWPSRRGILIPAVRLRQGTRWQSPPGPARRNVYRKDHACARRMIRVTAGLSGIVLTGKAVFRQDQGSLLGRCMMTKQDLRACR